MFIFSSRILVPLLVLASALLLCNTCHGADSSTKIGNGYRLISIQDSPDGGFVGYLQVKQKNNIYGPNIPFLQLYVKHETDGRLRVHITDAYKQRWEVPYDLLPRAQPPKIKSIARSRKRPTVTSEYSNTELIFSYTLDPFEFAVKRRSYGDTLFNSSGPFNSLVFKDQYLEISTQLPKDASLYGLGENTQPNGIKLKPNEPYTLYATDMSAYNLNTDLYGSHPVYMDLRNVGQEAKAHAVLLLNSNGMDVVYTGTSLTYKVIGGVLDFYFFSGPTPLAVVDQYTEFVGRPAAMPYWSLGFHQSRWGYRNLSVVEETVENYKKAQIPLDVIWNDDDTMDSYKDFSLNRVAYPRKKLLAFLNKLHSQGMKYIVLIDPGINVNSTYDVYQRGMANDVFIKYHGKPYLAQVWPGAVYFPDFLNPKTVSWWGDEIKKFHELIPVDGLWLDMNEASNFCSGFCTIPEGRKCPSEAGPRWDCCLDCRNITNTRWDNPPYKINASGMVEAVGFKTISTSATHYNGVLEYNAHSLYGFSQTIATHKALKDIQGKRPFILTRSTYVGSGHYAAHWTGDNKGTWEDLRYSISTILNFGIFGIPMVGSDICGFYPAPTEELCNRWIELGAFYPFSRDHANYYSPKQELYQWESVAKSARNALGLRYKLLPHLYTLTYEAHISGAPIARPLFFSFPQCTMCNGLSTQFLIGSSLMVSPVLEPNETKVDALFPPGTWYNMFNMSSTIVLEKGQYVSLDAPLHVINVHVYQNAIIPMQRGGLTSKVAKNTPFSLVVTFPAGATKGEAAGNLFVDEDELPDMKLGDGFSTHVDFHATINKGRVKVWSDVQEPSFALARGLFIEKVIVLGLNGVEGTFGVEVDNAAVDVSSVDITTPENYDLNGDPVLRKSMMVEIKGLKLAVGKKFTVTWKMAIKN